MSGAPSANGTNAIVDAWIKSDQLVLLSPSFARLEIPLEKLRRFIGDSPTRVAAFQLDEGGRYLFWPHADVHMGWAQLQQLIDPTSAVRNQQASAKFNEQYGAAIRALREEAGLKQSDIQRITERQLRRVEHGERAASKVVLSALAEAHSQSLDAYLASIAKALIQNRRAK